MWFPAASVVYTVLEKVDLCSVQHKCHHCSKEILSISGPTGHLVWLTDIHDFSEELRDSGLKTPDFIVEHRSKEILTFMIPSAVN